MISKKAHSMGLFDDFVLRITAVHLEKGADAKPSGTFTCYDLNSCLRTYYGG